MALGALVGMKRPGARGDIYALNNTHLELLLDAQRLASLGALKPPVRLILVPRVGVRPTWELIRSGRLVDRLLWLLETAGPALVLAVDERVDESRGASVIVELDGEGIPCDSLEIRRAVALEELGDRASYYLDPGRAERGLPAP
jgi:hypothetical protein